MVAQMVTSAQAVVAIASEAGVTMTSRSALPAVVIRARAVTRG